MLNNVEAEKSLIGKLIDLEFAEFAELELRLSVNLFTEADFRIIYQAIAFYYQEGKSWDMMTIADYLQKENRVKLISRLPDLCLSFNETRTESLIDLLSDYRFKRESIAMADNLTELATANKLLSAQELADVELEFAEIVRARSGITQLQLVGSNTERVTEFVRDGSSKGTDTGIKELNSTIGGFKPGKIYIIGARPGMGKTNFGVYFSLKLNSNPHNYPVLFISAEMSLESLSIRFIANLSRVNSKTIADNYMSYEEQDRFRVGLEKYQKLNLIIDESPAKSLDEKAIAAKLHSITKTYGGVAGVVIDYIQLLGSYDTNQRHLAIGETIRSCKDLSKQYQTPFLVLSQVNRGVETRQDKRPTLADLKDSGSLEQAADVIMFVYRDEYYNANSDMQGVTELDVAKHRDGPTAKIELRHRLEFCDYTEYPPKISQGKYK